MSPALLLIVSCIAMVLGPAQAFAQGPTFTVSSTADVPASANVGDGVCETGPGNGVCTLRAAVMEANAVPGGGATIRLPAAVYFLLIAGAGENGSATGDLDVTATMTIEGDGAAVTAIDGSLLDRILHVHAPDVTLRGVAIRNGTADSGGGVQALADGLTLEDVVLSDNRAGSGGALYNAADVTLRRSSVTNNVANNGGGLFAAAGTLHLIDSIVRSNRTTPIFGNNGGGLHVLAAAVRIERSAILDNAAELEGGGIYVGDAAAEIVVLNSTIAGNGSAGGNGGGVLAMAGSVQIIASTISGNYAVGAGGGLYEAPGGASIFLKNSVLTDNTANNFTGTTSANECGSSPITSGDYNRIAARSTCSLVGATANVNASNLDLELQALAPNGGFGPDRRPADLSAVVDQIPAESCSDELAAPLRVDQRGYRRDGPCDIGAHESAAGYAPDLLLGVELLRNGGALGNEVASPALVQPPYWSRRTFDMRQVVYGASPDAPPPPAGSGRLFFDGADEQVAGGSQWIDLSALAAEIDAGQVWYTASGRFGGKLAENDSAALGLLFTNGVDVFESRSIGGFTAADRGGVTQLLPDSESGPVPVGTRFVDVTVEMVRTDGTHNDGYADDLSLVLPEPAPSLLGGAALLAVASLRARRSSRSIV